jgi:hypothetical protein
MVVVDSYQDNGKMKLKATCNLPIDTKLENFYILLLFTFGSFVYSVAFQFYNNNDTLKISLFFRHIQINILQGKTVTKTTAK